MGAPVRHHRRVPGVGCRRHRRWKSPGPERSRRTARSGQAEQIAAALGYQVVHVHTGRRPAGPAPTPTPPLAGCHPRALRAGKNALFVRQRAALSPPMRAGSPRFTAAAQPGSAGHRRAGPPGRSRSMETAYCICPSCGGTGSGGRPSWSTSRSTTTRSRSIGAPTCPTCSSARTVTTARSTRRCAPAGPARCGPARRHEPVGAAGAGLPAAAGTGRSRGATWPAWNPHSQIDHILVRGAIEIGAGEVLPAAGSDHRPVRAELVLR